MVMVYSGTVPVETRTSTQYPTEDSTGIPYGTVLETWTGSNVFVTFNQVISGYRFPQGMATLDIQAGNVTFENCLFNLQLAHDVSLNDTYYGTASATFINCEFQGPAATPGYIPGTAGNTSTVRGSNWSMYGCRIRGYSDGMHPDGFNTISGCYVSKHDTSIPTSASSAKSLGGTQSIHFFDSTLILDKTSNVTGVIALSTAYGGYTDIIVAGCLLAGGAFTIYPGEDGSATPPIHTTGLQIVANLFSRQISPNVGTYGWIYEGGGGFDESGAGNVWAENVFDNGIAVPDSD
jgi:hypothetical protein